MPRNIHRRVGFTLAEVVIVMAIIGIAAAFAIPSLVGYIDTAERLDCESRAERLLTSLTREISPRRFLGRDNVTEYAADLLDARELPDGTYTVDYENAENYILLLSFDESGEEMTVELSCKEHNFSKRTQINVFYLDTEIFISEN